MRNLRKQFCVLPKVTVWGKVKQRKNWNSSFLIPSPGLFSFYTIILWNVESKLVVHLKFIFCLYHESCRFCASLFILCLSCFLNCHLRIFPLSFLLYWIYTLHIFFKSVFLQCSPNMSHICSKTIIFLTPFYLPSSSLIKSVLLPHYRLNLPFIS